MVFRVIGWFLIPVFKPNHVPRGWFSFLKASMGCSLGQGFELDMAVWVALSCDAQCWLRSAMKIQKTLLLFSLAIAVHLGP